jgi:hypothetical protein
MHARHETTMNKENTYLLFWGPVYIYMVGNVKLKLFFFIELIRFILGLRFLLNRSKRF